MKHKKPKSRIAKVDLDAVLKLQKDYQELIGDCKAFLGIIVNLSRGEKEPVVVEFNDPNDDRYLKFALEFIREHATWNKDGKEV